LTTPYQQLLIDALPRLRAYAHTLTGNRADAEDLVQNVAVKIVKFEHRFVVGTNFPAWTYRILKNCHISSCRKNKMRCVSIDNAPEEAFARAGEQEAQVEAGEILRAIAQLPTNLREVLTLFCGAQLSYQDAASAMGCSVGTVKSRLWRARSRMQALLMPDTPAHVAALPAAGRGRGFAGQPGTRPTLCGPGA
jgi:RNA polymerase sigma-70 factor (ECF subfamily)